MCMNGYISLHRKMVEWGWYDDPVVKCVFLHILLTASFKESEWHGIKIMPGDLITSYGNLAKDLGFSVKQIRTALDKLKRTSEVAAKTTNRYTLISVSNWAKYQITNKEIEEDGQATWHPKGNQRAIKGQHLNKVNKLISNIYISSELKNNSEQVENYIISLPLNDKTEYGITQDTIDYYSELYPAVNIMQEFRNMKGWCDAKPKNRKTRSGIKRFINNWLSRQQDKGGRQEAERVKRYL